ncbi:hypothetical protein BaRGS_00025260 [Batillaria attramentaria]|uniref:Uncharacterized protein n=1 Tax=Batillaria attramentaria TaxID=370345 RepID=A0ABD0K8L1_9CAEN
MADWTLLSFYTANTGAAHRLDSVDAADGDTGASASQEIFCTGNNISSCVAFLNQELQLLGLPAVSCNNKGNPDTCSLLNRAYDLFRLYQRLYSTKDELENRVQRLSGERDHHRSSVARATRQHEALERGLAQETEKLRQLAARHKVTAGKLKAEKEEVKCLQSVMHHKDLQFKHEQKKKEREINKLKDRLHQLLMDKNPDRRVGMDLMNTVQNTEGKRAQWKTGLSKQEEEMYQMLIRNYEERHRELVLENTELRDCLLTMQRELSTLLKQTDEVSTVRTQVELNEGYYQMPYDMVRREIERAFKQTCERIGLSVKRTWKKKPNLSSPSKVASPAAKGKDEHTQEIQCLSKQIDKYKEIIQQQEQLIQHSLQTHSDSYLHESQILHEKDMLAKEKKLFYEEKAHFEEERKLFTEAAIKLGRERQAIQEERMKILKEHFLNITPFHEKQNQSRVQQKEGMTRLLPATPNFSPAPEGKIRTPSTAELFRALGLAHLPSRGDAAISSTPQSPQTRGGICDTSNNSDAATPTNMNIRMNLFSTPSTSTSEQSPKPTNH